MRFFCLMIFILSSHGVWANSTAVDATGSTSTATTEELTPVACTSEQIKQNRDIINLCKEKWSEWSPNPFPSAGEVRKENECYADGGDRAASFMAGCMRNAMAIPLLILSLFIDENRVDPAHHSLERALKHGTVDQIISWHQVNMMKTECKLFPPGDEHKAFLEEVGQAHGCVYHMGNFHQCPEAKREAAYNQAYVEPDRCVESSDFMARMEARTAAEFRPQAEEVFNKREIARRFKEAHEAQLTRIKRQCFIERHFGTRSSAISNLNPLFPFAGIIAQQVMPTQASIDRFNRCVEGLTAGDPKFQEALISSTAGLFDQLMHSFDTYQCYNQRERNQLACEVASVLIPGGALAVSAASKLARRAGRKELTEAEPVTPPTSPVRRRAEPELDLVDNGDTRPSWERGRPDAIPGLVLRGSVDDQFRALAARYPGLAERYRAISAAAPGDYKISDLEELIGRTNTYRTPRFSDPDFMRRRLAETPPEYRQAMLRAFNHLGDQKVVTEYMQNLFKEAAVLSARRGGPNDVGALTNGVIDGSAIRDVLISRFQRRGEGANITTFRRVGYEGEVLGGEFDVFMDPRNNILGNGNGTGSRMVSAFPEGGAPTEMNAGFRAAVRTPFFDELAGSAGRFDHGSITHLMHRDIVNDVVNRSMGGNGQRFWDFMGGSRNIHWWSELFDAGFRNGDRNAPMVPSFQNPESLNAFLYHYLLGN